MSRLKSLFLLLTAFVSCYGASAPEPMMLSLYGERIQIKTKDKDGIELFVQPGRLTYIAADGVTDETGDTYFVAILDGRPSIIDRAIGGYEANFEVKDINSDGVRELLFFYHAGGSQYALRLYRINEGYILTNHFTPITGAGLSSNLHSIEIRKDRIYVSHQQFSPPHGAVRATESYKLDSLQLVLEGTRLEFVPIEK